MTLHTLCACGMMLAVLSGCADRDVQEREPMPSSADRITAGTPADTAPTDSIGETDVEDEPTPAEWTAGLVQVDHDISGVAVLSEVRAAPNEGFDRIVLEFDVEIPSYSVEYIDRPVRQCGSGDVVEVAGDGWLAIRLTPAQAHDEEGRVTVEERSIEPELTILRQLTIICDFEAHLDWIAGVASPNRFRVMELHDPARLVIDIRH